MTQLLPFLIAFGFSASAMAVDISDVDQFLGEQPFEQAFVLKDFSVVLNNSCISAGVCSDFESTTVVVESNDQFAGIEVWDAGGKKQQYKFTRSQWQEFKGNMLRNTIRFLESFGQRVEIQTITPIELTLLVNKKPRLISALDIRATAINGLKITTNHRWIIGKGLGALGQMLLREDLSKGGRLESRQLLSFSRSDQRTNF